VFAVPIAYLSYACADADAGKAPTRTKRACRLFKGGGRKASLAGTYMTTTGGSTAFSASRRSTAH